MLDIDLLLKGGGLYRTDFGDNTTVTYRLLTLKEYRVFRALRDTGVLLPHVIASMVFSRCNLGGELAAVAKAGVEVSVGRLIMYLSGDCESETLKQDLAGIREAYPRDSVTEVMKRVICIAFPSYKWEELDGMTRVELLHRFTVSEAILSNKSEGYQPLDIKQIKSPEEMSQKKGNAVDFVRENAKIRQAVGYRAEGEEARTMDEVGVRKLKKAMANRR